MRTIVVACGIALALMAGLVNVNAAKADPPQKPNAEKLRQLLEERRDALKEEYGIVTNLAKKVPEIATSERLCALVMELLDVDLQLKQTPSERIDAYKFAIEELGKLEKQQKAAKELLKTATAASDYLHTKETRLKVEIKMTQEQMKQAAK
jgi:hypothetical protein